jgi:hypothetical protein
VAAICEYEDTARARSEIMRESKVGCRRWVAGSVALVVVLGIAGCGGAGNGAVPAKASPADKNASLANWTPRLGKDEARRIHDCLSNHVGTQWVGGVPGDRSLVDFLPHLLYYASAAYSVVSSDAFVEVAIYIFDSPSTAERWARISRANAAAGIIRRGDFAHGAADSEVRRARSVVSVWSSPHDASPAYRSLAAECSTR